MLDHLQRDELTRPHGKGMRGLKTQESLLTPLHNNRASPSPGNGNEVHHVEQLNAHYCQSSSAHRGTLNVFSPPKDTSSDYATFRQMQRFRLQPIDDPDVIRKLIPEVSDEERKDELVGKVAGDPCELILGHVSPSKQADPFQNPSSRILQARKDWAESPVFKNYGKAEHHMFEEMMSKKETTDTPTGIRVAPYEKLRAATMLEPVDAHHKGPKMFNSKPTDPLCVRAPSCEPDDCSGDIPALVSSPTPNGDSPESTTNTPQRRLPGGNTSSKVSALIQRDEVLMDRCIPFDVKKGRALVPSPLADNYRMSMLLQVYHQQQQQGVGPVDDVNPLGVAGFRGLGVLERGSPECKRHCRPEDCSERVAPHKRTVLHEMRSQSYCL